MGGNVFRRGERWQAQWKDAEGRRRSKSFASEALALAHLEEVSASGYVAPSEQTVAQLIDESLRGFMATLSPRTVLTYRQRAEKMILPHLGKRRVVELTGNDIRAWLRALKTEGFAPSTIHAAMAVLNSALNEAMVTELIPRNPAAGVRRPPIRRRRVATWSRDEVRMVLRAVREEELYGALYRMALVTGMRPGELRGLLWDDVDLDGMTVTVRRTITRTSDGREVIGDATKTHKVRAVAFTADLATALATHRERQDNRRGRRWQEHGIVFDRGDGHWMYQSQWFSFHRELCARLGVPAIRLHDLRHTAATLMLEMGINAKVVSEMLGHGSIEITLDIYSHVGVDLQRSAATALGDLVRD